MSQRVAGHVTAVDVLAGPSPYLRFCVRLKNTYATRLWLAPPTVNLVQHSAPATGLWAPAPLLERQAAVPSFKPL